MFRGQSGFQSRKAIIRYRDSGRTECCTALRIERSLRFGRSDVVQGNACDDHIAGGEGGLHEVCFYENDPRIRRKPDQCRLEHPGIAIHAHELRIRPRFQARSGQGPGADAKVPRPWAWGSQQAEAPPRRSAPDLRSWARRSESGNRTRQNRSEGARLPSFHSILANGYYLVDSSASPGAKGAAPFR